MQKLYSAYVCVFIVALAFACQNSGRITIPDPICGLASPVVFTNDTITFYAADYLTKVPEGTRFEFPSEINVIRTSDSNVYRLVRNEGSDFLSVISVKIPVRNPLAILVKNLKNEKVAVSFDPGGKKYNNVKVRGSLNNWNALSSNMEQDANGIWTEKFDLPPGEYQYLIVAGDKEMRDPANPDSINNNIGGYNSLLKVGHYNQEELPFLSTKSYTRNTITLSSDRPVQTVFVFWQNELIEAKLNGTVISIDIPARARQIERSFIRASAFDDTGISNDILIPLQKGKVIDNASQLVRSDWHSMMLYFIMVDRFFNGNTGNDEPVEDSEIHPKANYFGGDLAGISQKIAAGYFDSLGVNALWLSPITQNPLSAYGLYPEPRTRFSGYHGYWPVALTKTDHRFGTDGELRELISNAHNNDMNMLLDYVAHHVHESHIVYKQHPDWATSLYLPDGTLNTEKWDEQRLTTWFDTFLPTLDSRNPEVVNTMTDSALYWITEYGFDGFRHDATKHVDELFWRTLTQKLKNVTACDPMVIQIGETYGSPALISGYIGSGMLDAQFDFNVYDDAVAVFARSGESFSRLRNSLNQSLRYYGYHNLMGYISGNQDRPRFISLAGGDLSFEENSKYAGWTREIGTGDTTSYYKLLMLHAFNFTIPGIPTIYYGDEIGMPGANDPDNRRQMRFESLTIKERWVKDVTSGLAHIRGNSLALLYGDLKFLETSDEMLVFIRTFFDDFAVVIFNKSMVPETITLDNEELKSLKIKASFGSQLDYTDNQTTVTLQPLSFEIILPE